MIDENLTIKKKQREKIKEVRENKNGGRLLLLKDEDSYKNFLKKVPSEALSKKNKYSRFLLGIIFRCDNIIIGIIKNAKYRKDELMLTNYLVLGRQLFKNKNKEDIKAFTFEFAKKCNNGDIVFNHPPIAFTREPLNQQKLESYHFYIEILNGEKINNKDDVYCRFEKHMDILAKMIELDEIESFDDLDNWYAFEILASKFENGAVIEVDKIVKPRVASYYTEKKIV